MNSKKFKEVFQSKVACELDALPRLELRGRVEQACKLLIDDDLWEQSADLEKENRERIAEALTTII